MSEQRVRSSPDEARAEPRPETAPQPEPDLATEPATEPAAPEADDVPETQAGAGPEAPSHSPLESEVEDPAETEPGDLLDTAAGSLVHVELDRVSPLAVPVMVLIGRETMPEGAADDELLLEAESLAGQAMRVDAPREGD